jgi:hypothetical protein
MSLGFMAQPVLKLQAQEVLAEVKLFFMKSDAIKRLAII